MGSSLGLDEAILPLSDNHLQRATPLELSLLSGDKLLMDCFKFIVADDGHCLTFDHAMKLVYLKRHYLCTIWKSTHFCYKEVEDNLQVHY